MTGARLGEPSIVDAYRPLSGLRDEMVDIDGHVRPTWSAVGDLLAELGAAGLAERSRRAGQLLDADGVTSHRATDAPWEVDVVPVVVAGEQWQALEAAVRQRAELLNAVLEDVYGARRLVSAGLLPPEVVFGHDGFVAAVDGVRLPGPRQLFQLATDLGRLSDGTYVALGDHTQVPTGAGHALESRMVVSRVVPGAFRSTQVQRLAPFFRTLRSSLHQLAAGIVDGPPRVVVYSAGYGGVTSFEDGYLAAALGAQLVQAADLVVSNGELFLRALGRLDRVHVVIRRVDAASTDPLELRPDSTSGVAGLVEACRLGSVCVVNTIGSGILENPALLPSLPALSRHLLGEPLLLESVPTWWCGERLGRSHVLANLERLVVRPVDRVGEAFFGAELSAARRNELAAMIEALPHRWVGQESVDLATVPTVTEAGLEPRRYVLRMFAVSHRNAYAVMPGGLATVVEGVANTGGPPVWCTKDTWVTTAGPESTSSYWLDSGPVVAAVDPTLSMSSRAAEQLFWVGRYAERAEATARLLRVVNDRRTEFVRAVNPAGAESVQILLHALTEVTMTYPGFAGLGDQATREQQGAELRSLLSDAQRTGTLAHAVTSLVAAASAVRDQLSLDTWLVIGRLEGRLAQMRGPVADWPAGAEALLGDVMRAMLSLSGLAAESMVRDPGWHFMNVGRRIERCTQLAALLRATLYHQQATATSSLVLESMLTAAESIVTYRRRYRFHAQVQTVLDLLVGDAGNPRSLAYQVDQLVESVGLLPIERGEQLPEAERLAAELAATVRLASSAGLAEEIAGQRPALLAFCERVTALSGELAEAIDRAHFTHLLPQRTLAGLWTEGVPS